VGVCESAVLGVCGGDVVGVCEGALVFEFPLVSSPEKFTII
jgi:hypothetical protein